MKLEIRYVPTETLVPYARNAKQHPPEQISQIAGSLKEFGFINPVIVDKDRSIVAGHGRVLAAQKLGMTDVPTIAAEHLTATQIKAFRLADNRIAQNGSWDDELLKIELEELDNLGVDLEGLGFDLDELPSEQGTDGLTDPDDVPETPKEVWVKPGDLFELGKHRLLCGDSTKAEDVARLMNGEKAVLMVTDPPYGVEYDASWRADASQASADLYDEKPEMQRRGSISNDGQADWSAVYQAWPAQIAYVWHASQFTDVVLKGLRDAGYQVRQQIIWNKPFAPMSRSAYHWKHEPCWYAVREGQTANWKGDRKQTTVWEFVSPLAAYGQTDEADKMRTEHPTQKPVGLMERSVLHHTDSNDIVCDPFLGSGSTLIACEKTGRRCYGMEIDPAYCQVILERWAKFTGKQWAKATS